MHIFKAKLPFYPPSEVKCRLQNEMSTKREKIRIMATKLPKMGGEKKKELWQKFNSNLGNEVAEN